MAYTSSALAPSAFAFTAVPASAKKRSLWQHVLDSLVESRQRQADRDIARFLGGTGCKFTDEAEREIERRLLNNSSSRW